MTNNKEAKKMTSAAVQSALSQLSGSDNKFDVDVKKNPVKTSSANSKK